MVQPLWKTIGQFFKLLNTEFPHDPEISFLITHPREMKTYVHTKFVHDCLQQHFLKWPKSGNNWSLRFHSTSEWENQTWYIHMMSYYSAIKMKEGISKTLCSVKDASHKRPRKCMICFLQNVQQKQIYKDKKVC